MRIDGIFLAVWLAPLQCPAAAKNRGVISKK
jgi:hypothetical protein